MTAPRRITLPRRTITQIEPAHDERRPSSPHISYSQLAMYLRCSMQYYFRYVLGLKERPKVSLSLGKGGHAGLEWNTKHKIATGQDHTPDEVVQKASDFMDFYLSDMPESEYEKDVEPGQLKDKQLAATRIYMVRDAIKLRPIGAEVEINLDMNKYLPDHLRDNVTIRPINMKLDLVYQDTDTLVQHHDQGIATGIEDSKFVTRKKTQAEVDISPQLSTYDAALHDLTGRWPTKLGIRMFHPGSMAKKPKADDPTPDSIQLLRQAELMTPDSRMRRLARTAYQFAQVERGIQAGIFIPTDDPMTCSWCGFRDRCQSSLVDDFEAQKMREQP